ncbi:MAG: cellulose biosynthesis protein CelD [Verrucomicrobiaceae bacterium]|nr:cellulose biosynthesis protein CelD [Verrucomicrobiaceae bacterium]
MKNCVHIREITDSQSWQALGELWDSLLQHSKVDCLFLTWDWIDSWMSVYGDGGESLVLVAEDATGTLLGVAAMMIDAASRRLPTRTIKRLTLIGQKADTASEYLDWIILKGREEEIARTFCHHLLTDCAHRWDVLEFGIMRADSPVLPVLRSMLGHAMQELHRPPAPFMALPDGWETFMAERSSHYRRRYGKIRQRLPTKRLVAGTDISVAEGMAHIRELNLGRWADSGTSFKSESYCRFHEAVAERMHQKGRLMMVFLELDDTILCGRYDFNYAGKAWCFQGGWSRGWESYSIGRVMMGEIMRYSIELGLKEYDFLAGAASYKDEWASGARDILFLHAWRPGSLRGFVWQQLRRLRQYLTSN